MTMQLESKSGGTVDGGALDQRADGLDLLHGDPHAQLLPGRTPDDEVDERDDEVDHDSETPPPPPAAAVKDVHKFIVIDDDPLDPEHINETAMWSVKQINAKVKNKAKSEIEVAIMEVEYEMDMVLKHILTVHGPVLVDQDLETIYYIIDKIGNMHTMFELDTEIAKMYKKQEDDKIIINNTALDSEKNGHTAMLKDAIIDEIVKCIRYRRRSTRKFGRCANQSVR